MPDYLPPCYWTSCAFASRKAKIVHQHPFSRYQDTKQIAGVLDPCSVFTWPFRLAMTHTQGFAETSREVLWRSLWPH
jgi:hypothetical protein